VTKIAPVNLAASVRQRLLNLSRTRREDFNLLLSRYAAERCLYRLSRSRHGEHFILKGAMLFRVWTQETHRPTMDLDLLAYGDSSAERLRRVFTDLCTVELEPDGLEFVKESITVTAIREDDEYHGQRVEMMAMLGKMRISLQVDVGFGDAVEVEKPSEYPTLLDFPSPWVKMYPKEYVVSEKLHAMVILGERNSRMKDFYDLWFMGGQFPFEGSALTHAMIQTFHRRKTPMPDEVPAALLQVFAENPLKRMQWRGFLNRNRLEMSGRPLEQILVEISRFVVPPFLAAAKGEAFGFLWSSGGPWVEASKSGAPDS
jgi:predicted nucleotidyltransferase component of viral defense system